MLEWFKCPDNAIIPVKDCLTKCRMDERCLTLPTLQLIAQQRKWSGTASTTQLLNGTMYSFLKLTKPYVVDPDEMAFAVLGTSHHKRLEDVAKTLSIPAEVALTDGDRDIIDLLCNKDGEWILYDYKSWGSYRVARALGIVEVGKKPDPSGATYKTSGKWGKAGTAKMINTFRQDSAQAENQDAELQLNNYCLKAEEKFNIHISKMRMQVTLRDGGLAVAKNRGLTRNIYMIPIPRLPGNDVRSYFLQKEQDLSTALSSNYWGEPCSNHECWDGKRCESYCEVAMYCPRGMLYQHD